MAGGRKVGKFNTRERAVSTDYNRLQAFAENDLAEEARKLYSSLTNFDLLPVEVLVDSVGTPLEMHVLDGLIVFPQAGTNDLFITPGVAYMVDPDGQLGSSDPNAPDPDDNIFKVAQSPGVDVLGTLTIAPNPGARRIDVIECRRRPNVVLETDNRDIFNPATGLFTPLAVTKTVRSELEFQVRQGVSGAGYPGNLQGWCPLAVASVGAGAIAPTVDSTTFWDVRPWVKDRYRSPFSTNIANVPFERHEVLADGFSAPGELRVSGYIETVLGPYRAGGTLRSGVPGSGNLTSIDALNAANQEPGFVGIPGLPWYLWCTFPAGLPRWVRYDEFPALRVPGRMRGIAVTSVVPPTSWSAQGPLAPIALPTSTGLGGTAALATLLAAGAVPAGQTLNGFVSMDRLHQFALGGVINLGAPTFSDAAADYWNVFGGVTHPTNARSLIVQFTTNLTAGAGVSVNYASTPLLVVDAGSALPNVFIAPGDELRRVILPLAGFTVVYRAVEIPLRPMWPPEAPIGPNIFQRIGMSWFEFPAGRAASNAVILGWRF